MVLELHQCCEHFAMISNNSYSFCITYFDWNPTLNTYAQPCNNDLVKSFADCKETISQEKICIPMYIDTVNVSDNTRVKQLLDLFSQHFHVTPSCSSTSTLHQVDFIARAPGRVNIIGEHIDYMDYGVLPMAIDRDVLIAVKSQDITVSDDSLTPVLELHIKNMHSDRYPPHDGVKLPISHPLNKDDLLIPSGSKSSIQWYHYIVCGFRAVLDHLETSSLEKITSSKRVELLVGGNVPAGSGLSSSSALVCASSVACLRVLNLQQDFTLDELAKYSASSERLIGLMSGGMDQAISFLGKDGFAQYIQFKPSLTNTNVKLPDGVSFVIGHSLVSSVKAETAAFNYNRRVSECRLGCAILALKIFNQKITQPWTCWKLQQECKSSLEEMKQLVTEHLTQESYTLEEVKSILGFESTEELKSALLNNVILANENDLKLRDRCLHVFGEAQRVIEFEEICNSQNTDPKTPQILGDLMNQSHYSCRDLYECSSPELDTLTDICRRTTSCIGSRLTGAGWGGACVSLVLDGHVDSFLDTVWEQYYANNPNLKINVKEEVLFSSKPMQGASIFSV